MATSRAVWVLRTHQESGIPTRKAFQSGPCYLSFKHARICFAGSHNYRATVLATTNSLPLNEIVLDLDPLNLEARRWLGLMQWWRRDYDSSLEQAQLILAIDPNYPTAHVLIGVTRCAQRKFDEAIPELRKCVELSNRAPVWLGWLGLGVALSGDVSEACALLAQLRAAAEQTYIPASSFAWIYLGLGELDEAFAWLNRAIDERDPMMTPIRSYPFLDPIRADPRFVELLGKMKLDF
jgi:tetratricopeptide (TPR) repeat protein